MSNVNNTSALLVLCGVLGVDTNSTSQSQMVAFSVMGIEDIWAFVEYVRDKHTDIEYAKPLQKLDQLAITYKELQNRAKNAAKYAKAEAWIQEIVTKCSECHKQIESERMGGFVNGKYVAGREIEWRHIYEGGKPYFKEKQLEALSRVGSFIYTAQCLKNGTLIDKLTSEYQKALEPPKAYEVLNDRTKNILRTASDRGTKSTKAKATRSDT